MSSSIDSTAVEEIIEICTEDRHSIYMKSKGDEKSDTLCRRAVKSHYAIYKISLCNFTIFIHLLVYSTCLLFKLGY